MNIKSVELNLGELRGIVREGFAGIQRQIAAEDSTAQAQVKALERRVGELELNADRNAEWKRGPLLLAVVGAVGVVVNVLIIVLT